MPTPDILRASEQFNAALLAREQYAFTQMSEMYRTVMERLLSDYELLLRDIVEKGETPSRMLRKQRYIDLMRQTRDELERFGEFSSGLVTVEQRAAIDMALQETKQLTQMSLPEGMVELMGSWNNLPSDALQAMVGFASDGSPLRGAMSARFGEHAELVREMLLKGVGLGWHPTKTVRELRAALDRSLLGSALDWARTEQIRASREASRQSYEANKHLVRGWVRMAQKDERTCFACIMLDGKVYPMNPDGTCPPMDDHVKGRCRMGPLTIGYSDILGVPVPESEPSAEPTGAQWFASLPEAQQRAYMDRELGKGAWDAWRGGKFQLDDIPHLVENKEWGDSWQVTRLSGLIQREAIEALPASKQVFMVDWDEDEERDKLVPITGTSLTGAWGSDIKFYQLQGKIAEQGVRMPTDDERKLFIKSLDQAPDAIKKLWKGDTTDLVLAIYEGNENDRIGYQQGNRVYIKSDSLDFPPLVQHEFIHYMNKQNYIASNIRDYHPPSFFDHSQRAMSRTPNSADAEFHGLDENLTMILSSYHPDRQTWISNLAGIERGVNEQVAAEHISAVVKFLSQFGWP